MRVNFTKIICLGVLLFFANSMYGQQRMGDNLGNHKAINNLDMNGKNINRVQVVNTENVVIGTASVVNNASVALQINGQKAILIPRVTNLLDTSSPAIPAANQLEGMIVYDLTTHKFYVRDNNSWITYGSTSLADAHILVGDAAGVARAVAMTGDVTISNAGVTAVGASKILTPMIANANVTAAKLADSVISPSKMKVGTAANQILRTNATNRAVWGNVSDLGFVDLISNQTIDGVKTFSSIGGLVATGNFGQGTVPTLPNGVRMSWIPKKGAFQVGQQTGNEGLDNNIGQYSFAAGSGVSARGNSSIAMGTNAVSSGDNAIAMGNTASALAQGAVALGSNVSTGSNAGSFVLGDNNTAAGTSGTNDAANQMLMRFRGGYKFVSAINTSNAATKGLTLGANGVAAYMANARALFTPLSLVDKGYVDSLSAAGPYVSKYLAETVRGLKTFRSDSGFVAIGTNGSGIIPATGAGSRMMFYPGKSAFRVGQVTGTQWDDANVGSGSTALGYNTIASGINSAAMGTNVSTGSYSGSFVLGDNHTTAGTSGTNDAANQMLMRFRGGYKFISAINASNAATKGLIIGADGTASYIANARALFTPLSLVDKGYVDSLSATGPYVSKYLAETVRGLKTFRSDSGFVSIGTNGSGIIPATGAGSRMMFYPGKSAFRVGQVTGTQWDDASIGAASTALGYNTTASGANSVAIGNTASALAQGGVALGSNVSTGSNAGSFVLGDNNTAAGTSGTNDAANQMLMRFRGGYKFVSAINTSNAATKGLTLGANGVAAYMANARALFTPLSLVDKGYVDSLSAAGPYVSKYLAETVRGLKTFRSDSGFVAIGTNGTGIIPATGAGSRMMFYPGKSAFRVGQVTGTQWDDANVGSGSTALGYNTIASGINSAAMGTNVSTGSYSGSFVLGDNHTAAGTSGTNDAANQMLMRFRGGYKFVSAINASNAATKGLIIGADGTASYIANARALFTPLSLVDKGYVDSLSAAGPYVSKYLAETVRGLKTFRSDSGFVSIGTNGSGIIPATGAGSRMMFYPGKSAFRVGQVTGTQWDDASIGAASTALGYNTTASGANSVAIGNTASALAQGGVALGSNVSTGSNAGSFVLGDNNTAAGTSGTNDAANQMLMRFRGGYKFVSAINTSNAATKGLTLGANGVAAYMANARALFTPLSLVDKGYVDSLSAAGPYVSKYLAETVRGLKTFRSDSGFVAIGTNGTGIIPATGAGSRMMFYPGKSAFRVGQVTGTQWDDANVGSGSTALGYNTIASGINSAAMGTNVSTGSYSGSFVLGDNHTAAGTSGTNDAANQMLMRFRGGYKFVSAINASNAAIKGLIIGADGTASYIANARALFTPLSLVDKGYVDSLSAAGPYVSKYLAETVRGLKTFRSDSGFVSIGTNGTGIIPATGAGTRMMFYPGKSAFRVGQVTGTQWDDNSVGSGSVALGYNTIASGTNAVAAGNGSTSSGNNSFSYGTGNSATGVESFAGGGVSTASGSRSLAIGFQASASGTESFAFGNNVIADADQAVAIGKFASTNGFSGAFALGDGSGSSTNTVKSLASNQMVMRFAGGYRFYTSANLSSYVDIAAGANGVSITSDRRKKENFEKVNGEDILTKIDTMQLTSWNYKGQDSRNFRHYGPMAQDFYQAFGKDSYGKIGNDTTISSADIDGVNMIAIQALIKRTNQLQEDNRLLTERNDLLVRQIQDMKNDAVKTFDLVNKSLVQQRTQNELQLTAIIELLKKSNNAELKNAATQILTQTQNTQVWQTNLKKDK